MNRNELTLEDILREDDLVNDLKTNSNSRFNSFFNNNNITKLIDYAIKMPEKDELMEGHKYPFNACEILCSDSDMILELLTHQENEADDTEDRLLNKRKIEIEDDELRDNPMEINDDENKILDNIPSFKTNTEDGINGVCELEKPLEKMKISSENGDQVNIQGEINENQINNKDEIMRDYSTENKDNEEKTMQQKSLCNNQLNNHEIKIEENDDKDEDQIDSSQSINSSNMDIIYHPAYANLNHFFNFLTSPPEESNYVLIGYFNKILNSLLENKGEIIVTYFLTSKDLLFEHLINHFNRQLIGECVYRILIYSTESNAILNERKVVFLKKMIEAMKTTKDEEQFINICTTLKHSISNRSFFKLFMTRIDIFSLLFTFLKANEEQNENNFIALYALLNQIINNLLKAFNGIVTIDDETDSTIDLKFTQPNIGFSNAFVDFEDKSTKHLFLGETDEENTEKLQIVLSTLLEALIKSNLSFLDNIGIFKNQDKSINETTYLRSQKVLGRLKLNQAELFKATIGIIINSINRNYFKKKINTLIGIIINSKIFSVLIDLFFAFEFNNLYQNIFNHILMSVINQNSPYEFINHVFIKEGIFERIRDDLMTKRMFSFNSNRILNSGLLAFEINFLIEVNNASNEYLKEILNEKKEMNVFKEIYINDVKEIFKGKLCQNDSDSLAFNNKQAQKKNYNSNIISYSNTKVSLNDLLDSNVNIYHVYKSGGNYQALLEEKKKEKEKEKEIETRTQIEKENSDDHSIFNNKDIEKEIEIEDNIILNINNTDINHNFDTHTIIYDQDEIIQEIDCSYYDNNYWNYNGVKGLILNEEDLLNGL